MLYNIINFTLLFINLKLNFKEIIKVELTKNNTNIVKF